MTKPLGDVALGEVRRWANTCDDEGGRLYALPLVDAYEELRAEVERLKDLGDAANRLLDSLDENGFVSKEVQEGMRQALQTAWMDLP